MEQIQNKCFWHIRIIHSGQPRWEIGKTYDIGIKKNFYSSFCDSFSPKGKDVNILIKEYFNYCKESVFEEIRLMNYPHLPSRLTSIWLIPDSKILDESLAFWIPQILTKDPFCIVKLKCTGNVHYANQKFWNLQPCPFLDIRENATKYWDGIDTDPIDHETEVLFSGKITVEKIVDPYHPV